MTSRPCLVLMAVAALISVGCSSGNSSSGNSSGGGGGTPNPLPSISSITPPNANAGSASVTITVTGEGFVSTSTLNWNKASRITTEVSDTQITATVTAADIAAAGAAQITVVNPAPGGGTSNPVGFVINGTEPVATPGFVYVANNFDGTISAFSIDTGNGSLNSVAGSPFLVPGAPFLAGLGPVSITADPSVQFLYVASNPSNQSSTNDLPAFAIDSSTGALSPLSGSPFNTGSLVAPTSLSTDTTGMFLYVADQNGNNPSGNNLSQFGIDAATGALTALSQAACLDPFGFTTDVVADPTDPFLFVSNSDGAVCSFSINSQGALQPVTGSPFSFLTNPLARVSAVAVDPFGKYVYAASTIVGSGPFDVWAFSITPGVGALQPVPGSPFATGGSSGDAVLSLAADPLGRFLYVGNFFDISGFSINTSTGALSMLAGFPISTQVSQASSLVVDPSGEFLYVANAVSQTVSAYAIDETTGALSPVSGSPFPAGTTPLGLTVTRKLP